MPVRTPGEIPTRSSKKIRRGSSEGVPERISWEISEGNTERNYKS